MLYELRALFQAQPFKPSDISVIIALRLHDRNPWALERLRGLAAYYEGGPRFIVVDFGSEPPFAAAIASACSEAGHELVRVDDGGVYSHALARNSGAARARTPLLFFSDIDCIGEADLFARLAKFADVSEMAEVLDRIVVLPVYHLAEESSRAIEGGTSRDTRSMLIARALSRSVLEARGATIDYVDPHSNFFLVRRDYFDLIGGFNERFRGYGSEDFEFMLRAAHYSLQFPLPLRPLENGAGPRAAEPLARGTYVGFRRMLELMAVEAELAGLRIAHLHHPRAFGQEPWFTEGDRRRERLVSECSAFMRSRAALIDYDWMPRSRRALVLLKNADHADFMFPLRLAGYRLERAELSEQGLNRARAAIIARAVDALVVFNPYMRTHAEFLPLVETARAAGLPVFVVERGALPDSWYYSEDMSYRDPSYLTVDLSGLRLSDHERDEARRYLSALRSGRFTLEHNGSYEQTRVRHGAARDHHARVCLVPLQLSDDVAVTRFTEGFLSYPDFLASIATAADRHPDTLFLIKAHPLTKEPFDVSRSNLQLCSTDDNIHALIDLADVVVCYNSGVGLLALLHERPLVTLGNAYYNRAELGSRSSDLSAALAEHPRPPPSDAVVDFTAWLLSRKYAFLRGDSRIRESQRRRTHEYRLLLPYRLPAPFKQDTRRLHLEGGVAARSYAAARSGVGESLANGEFLAYHGESTELGRPTKAGVASARAKLSKMRRDPQGFLRDSRFAPMRWIARAWPGK